MTLEEAHVGRRVVYTPFKGCSPSSLERGVISSKNDMFVFVRYNKKGSSSTQSKATRPEDLKYY